VCEGVKGILRPAGSRFAVVTNSAGKLTEDVHLPDIAAGPRKGQLLPCEITGHKHQTRFEIYNEMILP
jgi:hypothetical protein